MIIQEENVEIVEDEKKKEDKNEENTWEMEEQHSSPKRIIMYFGIFLSIFLAILLIIFIIFTIYNFKYNNVIAKGIYIYGIDVSNLSKTEAKEKLAETFDKLINTNICLKEGDYETYISASEMGLEFDTNSAINYAYEIGKNGNIVTDNYQIFSAMVNNINIIPTYSINDETLLKTLNNISSDLPNAVVESSYYIEDLKLIITKGNDGYVVNAEQTASDIKQSISDFSYLNNPVKLSLTPVSPKEIDIETIYKEVYKEPTDAYYTTNPYTVHPSTNGLDFKISLEKAKEEIANAEDECEIPLKTVYPSVTTNMIGSEAFPDLLATYSTKYSTSNTNRVTNLKLAAAKINGTVLMPEEVFSYNKVLGKRTIAAGYKEAGIYENGKETTGLAGGICQISTTLFNAALLSNMEMVEVHNHQFVPLYSSAGRDATVVYGTKDFKFKNTRNYAVKIKCSVSGGMAKFSIYGIKEDTEYDVSISAKITSKTSSSIKSTTYRILKQGGKTISTEKIYNCTYKVHE